MYTCVLALPIALFVWIALTLNACALCTPHTAARLPQWINVGQLDGVS